MNDTLLSRVVRRVSSVCRQAKQGLQALLSQSLQFVTREIWIRVEFLKS